MDAFITLFNTINNKPGIIYIFHTLFGNQSYQCEHINVICDKNRIGVKLKGQDLYIPMSDIIKFQYDTQMFWVKSNRQEIKIIL